MDENRALLSAVINRAILDLNKKAHRAKALAWIKSSEKEEQSFSWYCNLLDMDPERTRVKILKKQAVAGKSRQ